MKPSYRGALAAALSLLVSIPAVAADNYTIQSGGVSRTIRAKDIGGVLHPMSMAIDGAGLERFTTANPGYVLFPPGTVLPISATALPLPAGAATAAAQATVNAALGAPTDAAWDGVSGSASITAILKGLQRTAGGGGTATTLNQGTPGASPWPVTWATGLSVNADLRIGGAAVAAGNPVPVSLANPTLPANASTAAAQATGNASLSSIDTKLPALASGRVPVDGSGVTQPISGTVAVTGVATAANQTTANGSLASIVTNTTGAATAAKQPALGTAGSASADVLSVQGAPGGTPLNVALTGTPPVIHTPTSATGSVLAYTAGTTAAQALAAGSRRFLAIDNESTTATIACTFGATYTAGINTAGSFTIPPSATRTWGNTFVPSDALFCVASAASTPVTIQSN